VASRRLTLASPLQQALVHHRAPIQRRGLWGVGAGHAEPGRQTRRKFGHVNGYAEAVDGAVFVAGMVSLGFVERDTKTIVRKAARLIHPDSPYRKCLDLVIAMADAGKKRAGNLQCRGGSLAH